MYPANRVIGSPPFDNHAWLSAFTDNRLGEHPSLVQEDDSIHDDTRGDARITTRDSWPFAERRLGRAGYSNRHLIALLRGQAVKEGDSAGSRERDAAVNPGSTVPLIFLAVVAIVLWAVVGLFLRLVIWLVQQL